MPAFFIHACKGNNMENRQRSAPQWWIKDVDTEILLQKKKSNKNIGACKATTETSTL